MNKPCARPGCGKTVYPLEELKCLDKTWHKQCFKCTVCGMTLNMKNYKGYEKNPYCDAHYPKTKASVVSDTPEMRRLAENTKNQSMVKYHEDFEKMKGHRIQIQDDPETLRLMKNTQVFSNVAYHGDVERKEAMDSLRQVQEQFQTNEQANSGPQSYQPPPGFNLPSQQHPPHQHHHHPHQLHHPQQMSPRATNGTGLQHEGSSPVKHSPYSAKMQQGSTLIYSTEHGGRVPQASRNVGSIADYDPMNGEWGSISTTHANASGRTPSVQQPYQQRVQAVAPTQHHVSQSQGGANQRMSGGSSLTYRAMYDYTAGDSDEVSFLEGDVIKNCQAVDQGWMTGTVERTGKWGMLPANYVQRVN